MIKDWSDAFKEKLLSDEIEVPDGSLDVLEGKIRYRRRKRLFYGSLSAITAVAAAFAAVLLVPRPTDDIIQEVSRPEEMISQALHETVPESAPITDNAVQAGYETDLVKDDAIPSSVRKEPLVRKDDAPAVGETAGPEDVVTSDENEGLAASAVTEAETKVGTKADEPKAERGDNIFEIPEDYGKPARKRSKRLSVNLFSGTGASSEKGVAGNVSPAMLVVNHDLHEAGANLSYGLGLPSDYSTISYPVSHRQPVTFGLSLSYGITDRLFITSGLDYSLCYSDIYLPRPSSGSLTWRTEEQFVHYIGVPLHLDWALAQTKTLSFYVGFGGEARKCIKASSVILKEGMKDSNIYFSAIGLAGLKYRLFKGVDLFVEPQYSHTFLKSDRAQGTYIPSAISDQPDMFSFRVGMGLSFK